MDEELRGVLDAMFAKPAADVAKEAKKKLHREFVQSFVNAVHHAIREHAGTAVAFGDKLRFSLWYDVPDDLREDMPEKWQVVFALQRAVYDDASMQGFKISIKDTGYRDEQVCVSIRRK